VIDWRNARIFAQAIVIALFLRRVRWPFTIGWHEAGRSAMITPHLAHVSSWSVG
jgi:hypothetical protein